MSQGIARDDLLKDADRFSVRSPGKFWPRCGRRWMTGKNSRTVLGSMPHFATAWRRTFVSYKGESK